MTPLRARLALVSALALACTPVGSGPMDAAIARSDTGLLADATSPVDAATPVDAAAQVDAAIDAFAIDAGAMIDAAVGDVTTVRVVYPSGHTIVLRGSVAPLSWTADLPLTDLGGGTYETSIHGLAGPAELKPFLDGTSWSRGPNYHLAPGQRIELAPHFFPASGVPASGRVVTLIPSWSSSLLGNTRAVYAYLPAGYDENTAARFTVLYMHDGQNLFDPSLAFGGNEWQVDEAMDAAESAGRCPDASACTNDGECGGARCDTFDATIVIGIANSANRIGEYTPTTDPGTPGGGDADTYLSAIVSELMPRIDTMLRTRTGPADTALMGSSLGGLVSVHAGVMRPETFGIIGAMSPSTWWDGTEILGEVASISTRSSRALRVYVDSGDAGPSMDDVTDTAMLATAYRAEGYVEGTDFHYVVQPGGQHSEVYWAERLPSALAFMLPRRERTAP